MLSSLLLILSLNAPLALAATENFQCQDKSAAVTGSVESTRRPNVFTVTLRALSGATQEFSANPATGFDFNKDESISGYYDLSTANQHLAFETRTRRDGTSYKQLTVQSSKLFGDTVMRTMPCL